MDAYSADANSITYSNHPPVLVVASSDRAMSRALGPIEASGARVATAVGIAEARQRMEQQAAVSALWLELDEDGGSAMDELLLALIEMRTTSDTPPSFR